MAWCARAAGDVLPRRAPNPPPGQTAGPESGQRSLSGPGSGPPPSHNRVECPPHGWAEGDDHTFTHFRERWYPTLIDRRGYEAWRAGGSTTMAQRAADRVAELLASDTPTPLPPDVEGAVRAVVDRVQAAAGL